jgi:hypothetical protein
MAEKVRAALCRREAAIRALLDLIRRTVAGPGNGPADTSPARLLSLRAQVAAELAPVVRPSDLASFDVDRAFATVSSVAVAAGAA